jgi:hypothetical protein
MKNYYDKTWKIGELARVFNINVQLLRHYDKEGLLTPDIRNPENKWRTYRYDQIYTLGLIRFLRHLDCSLDEIRDAKSYDFTVSKLKEIKGVGDKVAACCALFGFGNLEAFPIDVWMKRAIDTYFDGKLDPTTLGRYAGFAQQYIFHYIRNLSKE